MKTYKKVYVEITNVCNMSCSFCHGHKRDKRFMNIEEFSTILDKLTDKTKYIYYHLMGEPLTHPLLPKFIALANKRGYKSIITTNGTMLSKRSEELLSVNLHKVNISVHSFEENNISKQVKYINEIIDFAKKASENGTIVVLRLWNKNVDEGRNQIVLNALKENFNNEWKENSRGVTIKDKIYLEWGERFNWPDEKAEIQGNRFFCYGLKDQFGILVDGTVVPCCLDSEGVINLGNIFKDDLNDILNSKRAISLIEGFKKGKASEELCKRCGYAQRFI